MRSNVKHQGMWSLPGGKIESGETIFQAIERECQEEMGGYPNTINLVPIEKFTTLDNKFTYHTFFASVQDEFIPRLNDEHCGWAWIQSGQMPRPLHPGLWGTVQISAVQDKIVSLERLIHQDKIRA
jgi:8-oxo-dGTP pyrophosphatase MutT (NUDIX family)